MCAIFKPLHGFFQGIKADVIFIHVVKVHEFIDGILLFHVTVFCTVVYMRVAFLPDFIVQHAVVLYNGHGCKMTHPELEYFVLRKGYRIHLVHPGNSFIVLAFGDWTAKYLSQPYAYGGSGIDFYR